MPAILFTEEAKSFLENKSYLLSTPNVVSLGFSNEEVDGKETEGKIFRVGVIKKLPKENIKDPDIFIPKFFEHTRNSNDEEVVIPVIIVEEGELVWNYRGDEPENQFPADQPANPFSVEPEPPYKGASLIKNAALKEVGCLGANALYEGSYRLLSAAHVLTKFNRDYIGTQILVGDKNGNMVEIGATVTDQVDAVVYDTPTETPEYATQDLAWAIITPQEGSPEIKELGLPEIIRKINPGECVKYYGGYSMDCEEHVKVTDIMVRMRLTMKTHSGNTIKYVYFKDVCRMEPLHPYLGEGDSGTAILAQSDNALLGILMSKGSISGAYYFCKLML